MSEPESPHISADFNLSQSTLKKALIWTKKSTFPQTSLSHDQLSNRSNKAKAVSLCSLLFSRVFQFHH